ncbi:MAG TPA: chemotaxis protein CheX [Labilithrix sp.]|nr:chemotaxis protein CheX [Labilithrix sp.]
MTNPFEEFELVLVDSAQGMFAAYEKACTHAGPWTPPPPADEDLVVAAIGFAAEHTRGNLTLISARSVVKALMPAEMGGPADAALCDVLGEFANMLLGRLKNQLLPRGVALMIGMPTMAIVKEIRLKPGEESSSVWHRFVVDDGYFFMRFDATFDEEFSFTEEMHAEHGPVGAEGEMVLF